MHQNINIGEYLIAILFVIVGVCIGVFVTAYVLGIESNIPLLSNAILAGQFLFRSFHIGAFMIAVYFFIASALVFWERTIRSLFFDLTILSVPILTFSLGMRLLFQSSGDNSPIVVWMVDTFGARTGVLISFLFTIAIIAIILQFRNMMTPSRPPRDRLAIEDRSSVAQASSNITHISPYDPEREAPSPASTAASHSSHTPYREPSPPYTPEKESHIDHVKEEAMPCHTHTESNDTHGVHIRTEHMHVHAQKLSMNTPDMHAHALQNEESREQLTRTAAEQQTHPHAESTDHLRSPAVAEFIFNNGAFYNATASSEQYAASSPTPPTPPTSDGVHFSSISSFGHNGSASTKKWYLDPHALLTHYPQSDDTVMHAYVQQTAEKLQVTLREFGIEAEVVGICRGPVVTVYELLPAKGVKLAKISALADNIALSLAASRVRIVAPIPGKQAVGIELPNKERQVVGFDTLITHAYFQDPNNKLPIALGKGVSGDPKIIDLSKTPHLLIAGATGSGKSVCVNAIISSLLFRCSPRDVRMLLIDPKIVELKLYDHIPHLITPVITDTKEALGALNYCLMEMEHRYRLLDEYGVRDISGYNKAVIEKNHSGISPAQPVQTMPYLVVVIDEFADLMITGGKQLEITVARLAAMSRAVGIHLILATQRPSADVITGLIKANIPARIAFMVSGRIDSRIILDVGGAEQLLGQGDMLFVSSWDPNLVRAQGALVTDEDVLRITTAAKEYGAPEYIDIAKELRLKSAEDSVEEDNDPLYEEALQIIRDSGKASASYLQRRLQIGYNRAARLIEEMETRGIIGPPNGSKARELLHV